MQIVISALWGLAGWFLGSLVNYLADQLPETFHLKKPDCAHCSKEHSIARFIVLAKCSYCGQRRSLRSWLVQIGFVGAAAGLNLYPHAKLPIGISLLVLTYFLLVAVIDIEHRIILGPLSLIGMVLGAGTGLFLHGISATAAGGIAGGGVMWLLYLLGRQFSKWMAGRRNEEVDEEALGFGDVYIGAIIGLILGWPGITAGLFLAIMAGGIVSGLVMLGMSLFRRYQPFTALPYAPFLLLAALALLYR